MYKIGSHDTMSYLKPKAWYLQPFHFVAKCQNKTIEEQFDNYGIRLFDLRVRYNKKTQEWEFAHGAMVFKGRTPDEILSYLNNKNEKVYIRVLLEYNRPPKDINLISTLFGLLMAKWHSTYTNLTFFEFRRKYDWLKLWSYEGEPAVSMYQATSSTTWKILDDWWPWLYAKTHNKDNKAQGTDKTYLLMDYIGMW